MAFQTHHINSKFIHVFLSSFFFLFVCLFCLVFICVLYGHFSFFFLSFFLHLLKVPQSDLDIQFSGLESTLCRLRYRD